MHQKVYCMGVFTVFTYRIKLLSVITAYITFGYTLHPHSNIKLYYTNESKLVIQPYANLQHRVSNENTDSPFFSHLRAYGLLQLKTFFKSLSGIMSNSNNYACLNKHQKKQLTILIKKKHLNNSINIHHEANKS